MRAREQLFDFIKKPKVAFMVSIDEAGFPNMKAMSGRHYCDLKTESFEL